MMPFSVNETFGAAGFRMRQLHQLPACQDGHASLKASARSYRPIKNHLWDTISESFANPHFHPLARAD